MSNDTALLGPAVFDVYCDQLADSVVKRQRDLEELSERTIRLFEETSINPMASVLP